MEPSGISVDLHLRFESSRVCENRGPWLGDYTFDDGPALEHIMMREANPEWAVEQQVEVIVSVLHPGPVMIAHQAPPTDLCRTTSRERRKAERKFE